MNPNSLDRSGSNAGLGDGRDAARSVRWFYFVLAAVFATVAVTGFLPSYWMKIATHRFALPPIFHIHAALYFSWALLNLSQTWLVATGRTYDHRNWGLLGIALATAMSISIVLVVIAGIKIADSQGVGVAARQFNFLNIAGVFKFAAFFAAAIVYVRRADVHKRLMVVANSTILGAPLGRLLLLAFVPADHRGPPPAVVILLTVTLAYAPVVAGMLFDCRTRGRPHPVYWIGLTLGLGTALLVPVMGRTDAWMSFVQHLVGLLG